MPGLFPQKTSKAAFANTFRVSGCARDRAGRGGFVANGEMNPPPARRPKRRAAERIGDESSRLSWLFPPALATVIVATVWGISVSIDVRTTPLGGELAARLTL